MLLSFNLSAARLVQWPLWLQAAYNLTILWPEPGGMDAFTFFHREIYQEPLARMQERGMAFLDALILNLAESVPEADIFVAWNARHFRGKSSLPVVTPAEYMGSVR